MGFFDKMKSVMQAVTGGAAQVTIEFPGAAFAGDELPVRVTAVSSGGEVKSQGVFIDLLATERIAIPAATVSQSMGAQGMGQPAAQQPAANQGAFGGSPAVGGVPNRQTSTVPMAEFNAGNFPTGGSYTPAQPVGHPLPAQAPTASQHQTGSQPRDLNISHTMFSQSFQIAPPVVLGPGETRVFEGVVRLPVGSQPTYVGQHARHEWLVRGRLEAWGNDPDSGFLPLKVGVR